MKKNLLLAVCAAVVTQGLCAEPAAPVTLTNFSGVEGYSAQLCAFYQNNTVGECSAIMQVRPERNKPIKLKIQGLKFDGKNSEGANFHSYQLNILSGGSVVKTVDMIPQGARMTIGMFDGKLTVTGPRLQ